LARILIVYESLTGNTKKIAETIFDSLDGEKAIQSVEDASDADSYDLLFIGFPVHSHSIPFRVEKFLKSIKKYQNIAFFSTHGSFTGSRLSSEAIEHATVIASQARLLGTFSCRGKVSLQAMEVLSKSPEHQAWTEMAVSARKHPDENDLENAKEFAQRIMTLYLQSQ